VRKALILLVVVALLILVMGALNNGTAFSVDYAVGTVNAASLFWVSAVIAALVFVVGLVAAWFAQSAMTGARRKLEAELQSTYERLREVEALAARPAPAAEAVAATVVAEPEPETVVAEPEAATVVEAEVGTVVAGEAVTAVSGKVAGAVPDEDVTAVAQEPVAEEPAGGEPVVEAIPGEQTAITMAGAPSADDASSEAHADESAEDGPAADGAGRPGQSPS
jgi:uncharacterized membrane protein YciS (DUF1049 family)